MEYYIIYQDKRISNFAEPIGTLDETEKNIIKNGNVKHIDEMPIQFYIKEKNENQYLDYIEKPVPLVSDKLKQLLEKLQRDMFFKPVIIADKKLMKQNIYWLIVPKGINCISPKSEFDKNGTLKSLVIDENKVGHSKIFKVEGVLEEIIIMSLDLAECILRRDFEGIRFKKVEKA